jgi:hypothetical protein
MAAGWRSARLRVWAARVMCVALFCGHFGSCFLLPAACRPPLPSGLSTLASFQSLARKQQRIACARPLPAAARKRYGGLGNAKASLDFDSIRTSLRGAMQLAAAAGSIAVVVQALSSSVQKSGSAQSCFGVSSWTLLAPRPSFCCQGLSENQSTSSGRLSTRFCSSRRKRFPYTSAQCLWRRSCTCLAARCLHVFPSVPFAACLVFARAVM